MSKKKKCKDPWMGFVNKIFYRPRADRKYQVPVDYVMSIADQLHKTNPSRDIIYNTLVGFYGVAFERGWLRRGDDILWFKAKRQQRLDYDFNQFITYLDDLTHDKSDGVKLSFTEWKEQQQNLKSNNQPKK